MMRCRPVVRPAGATGSGKRRGVVLVVVLLLIALLGVCLASGAAIGTSALAISAARSDLARAQLAAEGAVRAAAFSLRAADTRGLAPLARRPVGAGLDFDGGATGRAEVHRYAGDAFLLVGEGRAGAARARAAMLVHVLSVASLLAPFPAALTAGAPRIAENAEISIVSPVSPPPPWSAIACDPAAADMLAGVFGAVPTIAVLDDPAAPPAGLGPVPWDLLAQWADRLESGVVRPAPVAGAACDRSAPGNWGAPEDASSPCAGWFPLVYAPGDLQVDGGSGQGVLVVRGNLVLGAGARFYGPVFVGGAVRGDAGGAVHGAVRARSADWAGSLDYCACALLRALSSSPGLGRAYRAGTRLWVPYYWP